MSVFENHEAFIQMLQKDVVPKINPSNKNDNEVTDLDIQAELEKKFDELFGHWITMIKRRRIMLKQQLYDESLAQLLRATTISGYCHHIPSL